jgi:hypothetical protein
MDWRKASYYLQTTPVYVVTSTTGGGPPTPVLIRAVGPQTRVLGKGGVLNLHAEGAEQVIWIGDGSGWIQRELMSHWGAICEQSICLQDVTVRSGAQRAGGIDVIW